jgi:hypothetical protein
VIEAAHVADFGKHREAPAGAVVHFEGNDPSGRSIDSIHNGDMEEMIPVNVTGRTDAKVKRPRVGAVGRPQPTYISEW